MKVFIALLAAFALLIPLVASQAPASDQREFVSVFVLVGKGFGIPTDGGLDHLVWIDKIAVGAVKKASQERRVGILKWTDASGEHKGKLRNIQWDNDSETVTADIYEKQNDTANDSKIGTISVSFTSIGGKEAWTGSLELNGWTGQAVIQTHKIKVENEHKMRVIGEERERGDCGGDDECEIKAHARRSKDDLRDREALKELCMKPENAERCKKLIEEGDVKQRAHVFQILSEETVSRLHVMEQKLQELETGSLTAKQRMEVRERLQMMRTRSGRTGQ